MIEQDLRDILRSRAEAVPVGPADDSGLGRRLAAARRRRSRARIAAGAAALALVLGATTLVAADDGTPSTVVAGPDPSSTTTAPEPSTTLAPVAPVETAPTVLAPAPPPTTATPASVVPAPTTATRRPSTTATTIPPLPADALWPSQPPQSRSSTPDGAADYFARTVLFMATPQVGAPQVSGSEARVDVRPLPNASLTTVMTLRRVAYWGWVVVGCAAPSIQIDQPTTGATVDSPLTVRGRAQTFEGNVELTLYLDPKRPIGDTFATAGGSEMLPFEAAIDFPAAAIRDAQNGVPVPAMLVAREPRADDGTQGPAAATVVRVMI